jgi:hypothetical protein
MKITNVFVAILLLTSLTSLCYAGASHVDCLNPIAYPDAAINVVFLPFDLASDAAGKKTGYFAELPLLMQLDTLLHLLPYGSVGTVQLDPPMSPSNECNVQQVTRRLFERDQIKANRGLIVVSGLLYQEGNDYYVKTFATFQRRDASEQINFPMEGLVLFANPSTQIVSFQPRHLTHEQLQQLEDAYQKANVVRPEPSLDSPGSTLPSPFANCPNGKCASANPRYSVTEQRGDWFRIQWFAPEYSGRQQADGWILAGADLGSEHLENFMPELYFIQGLAGYVVSRLQAQNTSNSHQTLKTLSEQFASYIDHEKEDDETEALAYELRGISTAALQQGDSGAADFNKAVQLDPSSADLRNLQACAEIWNAWQKKSPGSAVDGKEVIKSFRSAVALSGENHPAATNLSAFYQAAQKRILTNTGLSQEEIKEGIRQVKPQ